VTGGGNLVLVGVLRHAIHVRNEGNAMNEEELKKALDGIGSAAIVLGPKARLNEFHGVDSAGYEKAIVTLSDGENGPEGNKFFGGRHDRFQSESLAQPQSSPAPVVAPKAKSEPWYKQLGIQIAAAVIAALILMGLGLAFG